MYLPDYWLLRPPMSLDDQAKRACDAFVQDALAHGAATPLDYPLAIPKWQFLCYLVEHYPILLHGSGNPHITTFAPHQPQDLRAFGAQKAVYATDDGIWPLYFAIVDRSKSPTIVNACIRPEAANGSQDQAYYFFSISSQALRQQPYRDGMVYLLPRDTFAQEPPLILDSYRIYTAQYASLVMVQPVAKLAITPQDFPFLSQMRVHDDARLEEYATAMTQRLPLPT
jgi:hypothetical protein